MKFEINQGPYRHFGTVYVVMAPSTGGMNRLYRNFGNKFPLLAG